MVLLELSLVQTRERKVFVECHGRVNLELRSGRQLHGRRGVDSGGVGGNCVDDDMGNDNVLDEHGVLVGHGVIDDVDMLNDDDNAGPLDNDGVDDGGVDNEAVNDGDGDDKEVPD